MTTIANRLLATPTPIARQIYSDAHHVAYAAASMFLEKHHIRQKRVEEGMAIKHSYKLDNDDVVPIMELVSGAKLRNKHALPLVGNLSIARLLRQSFVSNQAWLADDVQVSVRRLMEPVIEFITKHSEYLEVFAGIYENQYSHTNVLGIYITLKSVKKEKDRMAWEITIDDGDLVEVASFSSK